MKNILIVIGLLCISEGALSQNFTCPNDAVLDRILSHGDLFFGETHGTVEIPYFLQCLVETAIDESNEKIIVSLEMDSEVRDPLSTFWSVDEKTMHTNEDGRSSQAMFELVTYLIEMEKLGKLSLHFQHPVRTGDIGLELQELSQNGLVIALAGNVHSSKVLFLDYLETEGMFVGENFTHINISSVNGGEVWACLGFCGINTLHSQAGDRVKSGDLITDIDHGHDYIYFLDIDAFTASPPMDNAVYR